MLVEDAELWWTHDLGAQPRYQATIRLRDGEQVLDERRDQIGLRTIALDRGEEPEGGRHFRFVLNGVPIFARGAAWLPADMLVGSVSEARYRELLSTARDGQMTMLRIWGGGIYEHDAFYPLCDELGLLVWRLRVRAWMISCGRGRAEAVLLVADLQSCLHGVVVRQQRGPDDPRHGLSRSCPGGWSTVFFDEVLPAARAAHVAGCRTGSQPVR